jgi:hypothetical protein
MAISVRESDVVVIRGRKFDRFRLLGGLGGELDEVIVHHLGLPPVVADDLKDGLHFRNS